MKNVFFKKTISLVLALTVILSAMSCLMFVSVSAATNYDNLTKLYDFEDGSAADFIQVGGKTSETTAGYESWTYNPEVADVTGLEKYTVAKQEIDYANENTVKAVTRTALLAKPYLNNAEGVTYALGNTASSATATSYVSNLGNTSMYVLKDTVDENGVALDTVSKKKISGKFSLDYYELGKTHNNTKTVESSPILIYYYKDANNWRGIKYNAYYKSETPWFNQLVTQEIMCENGYIYQTTIAVNGFTSTQVGTINDPAVLKKSVLNPDALAETDWAGVTPNINNTAWRHKSTNAVQSMNAFPTTGCSTGGYVPEGLRYGEWLNFSMEYVDGDCVAVTISDATGLAYQYMISEKNNKTQRAAYNAAGETINISEVDLSTGTFALGASFAIGNNTARGADNAAVQPDGMAFDDIKVEMTDSSETSVVSVVSAIDAIADEASYNTAKAAYANLTDSQKARVSNASDLNKWEKYFAAKRITYDFSEDWQVDAMAYLATVHNFSNPSTYVAMYRKDIITKDSTKLLELSAGIANDRVDQGTFYIDLPTAIQSEVEEATISVKGGLYAVTEAGLTTSNNGCATFVKFPADYSITNQNSHTNKFYKVAATGKFLLATGWNSTTAIDIDVDLQDDFIIKLVSDGTTKCKISFVGTQLTDDDADGLFTPSANTNYESATYTLSVPVTRVGLGFGRSISFTADSIDVKFAGWDEMVGLTAEEEALAARIEAIPEITVNNYTTVGAEVSAIRAAVDALSTNALADAKPEGSEASYLEMLAAAEAEIAIITGDVAKAQAFVDANNAILNTAKANVDTTNAQTIIDVHTAYEALTDAVKSILANNYALLDNAATGEKCFDIIANLKEIYDVAIPLCPTEAQIDFLEHYEANGIGALAAAEGKMDVLDASMALYNAVEETHKPNVQAKYDYILELLDKHFINGNEFSYNRTDIEGLENINEYFKNGIFTQSTVALDENRTKNEKILNPEKFDGTSTTHFKFAQDLAPYNAAGTGYETEYGFDLLPLVKSLPGINPEDSSKSSWTENYLYESAWVRSNKPTIYVNGKDKIPDEGPNGAVVVSYYCNSFGASTQQYTSGNNNNLIGTGEYSVLYNKATSPYYYDEATKVYRMPHTRIVYDCEYSVNYNPNYVAKDGNTYTRVTITFVDFRIWYEMEDDTTPYVYDAEEGSTDISLGHNIGGFLAYTYEEDEVALPQFRIDDRSLKFTQYLSITREDTFTEEYEEELEKEYTEEDADEVVELAKAAQGLTASEKALNADAVAKVEAAITNAGLRPSSMGSTLSVGKDTSIGFRAGKPAVENYDKFGIIVTTFNKMNAAGDKELTLADVSKTYAKSSALTYVEGDARAAELTFNIYGLFDDEAESKWGVWLVARYYTVYTAADGTEVTVYSTNDFGNTPTSSKENEAEAKAENDMIEAISSNGQLIRSVNGNIKAMATTLFGAKATYANEVGADYVNGNGETMTDYTGKTLAEAYGDDDNGMLDTAEATLYLMKAFKGVFTKILANQ